MLCYVLCFLRSVNPQHLREREKKLSFFTIHQRSQISRPLSEWCSKREKGKWQGLVGIKWIHFSSLFFTYSNKLTLVDVAHIEDRSLILQKKKKKWWFFLGESHSHKFQHLSDGIIGHTVTTIYKRKRSKIFDWLQK